MFYSKGRFLFIVRAFKRRTLRGKGDKQFLIKRGFTKSLMGEDPERIIPILEKYLRNFLPLLGSCKRKAWADRLKQAAFSSNVFFFFPKELGTSKAKRSV